MLALNRVGFLGDVERVMVSSGQAIGSRGFHTIVAYPMPAQLAREAERRNLETLPLGIDRFKASSCPPAWLRLFKALGRGRRDVTGIARRRNFVCSMSIT